MESTTGSSFTKGAALHLKQTKYTILVLGLFGCIKHSASTLVTHVMFYIHWASTAARTPTSV